MDHIFELEGLELIPMKFKVTPGRNMKVKIFQSSAIFNVYN